LAEVIFENRQERPLLLAVYGSLAAVALLVGTAFALTGDVGPGLLVLTGVPGSLVVLAFGWRNRVELDGQEIIVRYFFSRRTIDLANVADWTLGRARVMGVRRSVLIAVHHSGREVPLGGLGVRGPEEGPQAEELDALTQRLRAESARATGGRPAAP
jgi:hypothetical protein